MEQIIEKRNYLELSEIERKEADNMLYLLGSNIKDKIFSTTKKGALLAVNSSVQPYHVNPNQAVFCLQCRKGWVSIDKPVDNGCPHNNVIAIATRVIKMKEALLTLREQFSEQNTTK